MQKAGGAKARLFVYLNEHELKGENSGRVKKKYIAIPSMTLWILQT